MNPGRGVHIGVRASSAHAVGYESSGIGVDLRDRIASVVHWQLSIANPGRETYVDARVVDPPFGWFYQLRADE